LEEFEESLDEAIPQHQSTAIDQIDVDEAVAAVVNDETSQVEVDSLRARESHLDSGFNENSNSVVEVKG